MMTEQTLGASAPSGAGSGAGMDKRVATKPKPWWRRRGLLIAVALVLVAVAAWRLLPPAGSTDIAASAIETGEVTLKGTMLSPGGFVGMLQGSDGKTYIVRPGDRLLDGTIRSIAQDSLLITQHIDDPLSLEKEREVRKVLRQTQEAK